MCYYYCFLPPPHAHTDERRLASLEAHFSQRLTLSNKTREVGMAGGMFSRLEAQFRAQQAARTLQQGQHSRNM